MKLLTADIGNKNLNEVHILALAADSTLTPTYVVYIQGFNEGEHLVISTHKQQYFAEHALRKANEWLFKTTQPFEIMRSGVAKLTLDGGEVL